MFTFNAADYDPQAGIPVFPTGEYHFCIRKSNVKQTQKQDGGMLTLQFECLTEGPQKGKAAFLNLNLWNPNAQAVEIAQKELSAICHAVGVANVQGSQQPDNAVAMLHNIPFMCKVTVGTLPGGGDTNRFTNYRNAQGGALTRGQFAGAGPNGPQPVPAGAPQMPQGQMPQGQFPGAQPGQGGFPGAPGPQGGGVPMPGAGGFPGAPQGGQPQGGFPGAPGMAAHPPGQFPGAQPGGMPQGGGGFPGAPQNGFPGDAPGMSPQQQPQQFGQQPMQQQPQGGFPGAPQQQMPQQQMPQGGGFPGAPQPGQQPWGPQG